MQIEFDFQLKTCAKCKIEKPYSNFNKCKKSADKHQGYCRSCKRDFAAKSRLENPGRHNLSVQKYYKNNKEKIIAAAKVRRENRREYYQEKAQAYHSANRERILSRMKDYRLKNIDYFKAKEKYRLIHKKHELAAKNAKRRSAKKKSNVRWANSWIIGEIYMLSKLRTEATGTQHSVDHIVPLQSNIVCGLHCEHNLRVIPYCENASKGNRYWPDMPEAE